MGRRSLPPRLPPLLEALQHGKERGHEQHGEAGRRDDAAQHAETQRDAAVRSGAGGQHERHDPEAECERSHQDRAKPQARRIHRRVTDRLAMDDPPFARHLDDKDAVRAKHPNMLTNTMPPMAMALTTDSE